MAGAPAQGDASARTWTSSLRALCAAALAFSDGGLSVLVVVNYGRARKGVLAQLLDPVPIRHVLLLPPWTVSHDRAVERVVTPSSDTLPFIGRDAHRQFDADLRRMADEGHFDEVIDTSMQDVQRAGEVVSRHLGLLGP
jgi:hypothetical protein